MIKEAVVPAMEQAGAGLAGRPRHDRRQRPRNIGPEAAPTQAPPLNFFTARGRLQSNTVNSMAGFARRAG
jgi:hypothetical protein